MIRSISLSAGYLLIANLVFVVAGYGIHFFLGRYLGPAEYGIYGIVISLMSSVNLILTSGLPTALSRHISQAPPNKHSIIWHSALKLQLFTAVLISLIYLLASNFISRIFGDINLWGYFALSAFIFPSYSVYSLYFGYYNGLKRFRAQALLLSVYALSRAFSTVTLTLFSRVAGAIGGFILAPLIAILFTRKWGNKISSSSSNEKPIFNPKKMVRFAVPITIFSVAASLIVSADIFMVKLLLKDNVLVGIYAAASILARAPQNFYSAITTVVFPLIAKAQVKTDKNILKNTMRASMIVSIGLIVIVTIITMVFARYLINIFYSQTYSAAVPILVILALGAATYSIFDLFATIINGLGKPKIPVVIALGTLPLTIWLHSLFVPQYGLSGAAWVTTFSSSLMVIISVVCVTIVYRKNNESRK